MRILCSLRAHCFGRESLAILLQPGVKGRRGSNPGPSDSQPDAMTINPLFDGKIMDFYLVWYGGICHKALGPSVSPLGSSRCKSPPDE